MSILLGIELEWNDKDGTIDIPDDQAPNQDKKRVVAEMHIHEFGEEIVDAMNAYSVTERLNAIAIDLLLEMIDGGDELRGRDAQISHVIGVLKNDPNHTWLAKKRKF